MAGTGRGRGVLRILGLVLAGLTAAGPAPAGAWLQEEGAAFVSLSYEAATPRAALAPEALALDPTPPVNVFASLWAEYGLTPWLTVGIDAGGDDESLDAWSGVVFARVALSPHDWRQKLALQLGLGQRRYIAPGPFFPQESEEREAIARLRLSWGMGYARPLEGGWLALDGQVEARQDTGETARKLDATLGLRTTPGTALLLQVQTGDFPGGPPYAKLLTGLIWDLPWNFSLETSVINGLETDRSIGAKVGLWWRF